MLRRGFEKDWGEGGRGWKRRLIGDRLEGKVCDGKVSEVVRDDGGDVRGKRLVRMDAGTSSVGRAWGNETIVGCDIQWERNIGDVDFRRIEKFKWN